MSALEQNAPRSSIPRTHPFTEAFFGLSIASAAVLFCSYGVVVCVCEVVLAFAVSHTEEGGRGDGKRVEVGSVSKQAQKYLYL